MELLVELAPLIVVLVTVAPPDSIHNGKHLEDEGPVEFVHDDPPPLWVMQSFLSVTPLLVTKT
jgi:hypothetical protein